jgi:peptidoglycan/LPS O-acetylase OafA/YrhL
MLRRWSPARFFLVIGGAGVIIRLVGLFVFEQHLDWWSRGGLFPARLPEFAFGMAFAKWMVTVSSDKLDKLRSGNGIAIAVGLYLLGNVCSFFLSGMSIAFLLTGAGFFLFVFALFSQKEMSQNGPVVWAGRHSYGIYLFHHPVILLLVPSTLAFDATGKILMYLATTLTISILVTLAMETATNYVIGIHRRWAKNRELTGA